MLTAYEKNILNRNPKLANKRTLKQNLGTWQRRLNTRLNHLKMDLKQNGLRECNGYSNFISDFDDFCASVDAPLDQTLLHYVKEMINEIYQGNFAVTINFKEDLSY